MADQDGLCPPEQTSETVVTRDSRTASVMRLAGLGVLAAAVALTFIPGDPFGSIWTHRLHQFDGEAIGPFSSRAFRVNQMPLAIAAATAIIGVTFLLISHRLRGDRANS